MGDDILLRRPHLHYLSAENIYQFNDIEIKSIVDNSTHRTNSLVLACLSEIFLPVLKEVNTEETAILCEFSSEELEQLVSYVLGGYLKSSRYLAVFEAFGIDVSTDKRSDFDSYDNAERMGEAPEKEEIFYESKAKRRRESIINTEESSHSEEEEEDEEREDFVEGVPKQVCGFVRYPSILPINGKNREKTLQKLQDYGRDHCNYVRIGTSPELDREKLSNYDLPQPIESYLKPVSATGERTFPKGYGPFQCSICGCRCRTKKAIVKHKTKYHTDKYHCPSCRKDFPQSLWYEFIKHMFEHTLALEQTLLHECINCGYSTDVLSRLDHHRVTHGKYHNNECAHVDCQEKFASHLEYQIHVDKNHNGRWFYPCGLCPKTFADDRKEVAKHINAFHRTKRTKNVICDICGKAFSNETHLKTHLGSRRCKLVDLPFLKCHSCPFQTKLQSYLNKVSLSIPFLRPFCFIGCPKKFGQEFSIKTSTSQKR